MGSGTSQRVATPRARHSLRVGTTVVQVNTIGARVETTVTRQLMILTARVGSTDLRGQERAQGVAQRPAYKTMAIQSRKMHYWSHRRNCRVFLPILMLRHVQ